MTTTNGYATRDVFLAPAKRRFKDVMLPVRGIKLRIRSLMEREKEEYEAAFFRGDTVRKDKLVDSRRRLIVLCLCDADGQPILSNADLDSLKDLDGADIAHLARECEEHCGFKPGEIEATEKNSEAVRAGS